MVILITITSEVKVDEIAVWHRTLSAAEVTKVYETSYFGTPLL